MWWLSNCECLPLMVWLMLQLFLFLLRLHEVELVHNKLVKFLIGFEGKLTIEHWKNYRNYNIPVPNLIVNFVAIVCVAGYGFDDCWLLFEVDFQLNRYEHGHQGPFYDFD